jgi:hypothetical protein
VTAGRADKTNEHDSKSRHHRESRDRDRGAPPRSATSGDANNGVVDTLDIARKISRRVM